MTILTHFLTTLDLTTMTKQTKTTSPNTGEHHKKDRLNFELTSLGILMHSYEQNGVHIANRDKYIELYFIELEQAYINGRSSALSEVAEG